MIFDIDASVKNKDPNYNLIKDLASECRMPLCYGGGITSAVQVEKVISLGVEKVAISSAAIQTPEILIDVAGSVGTQSVVLVLDVKKKMIGSGYNVFTLNGKRKHTFDLGDLIDNLPFQHIGELVINSIDQDGQMSGYDLYLANYVAQKINIPMTMLGGAGSTENIREVLSIKGVTGACCGSLFVFKGSYRAVLINYPNIEEKKYLTTNTNIATNINFS